MKAKNNKTGEIVTNFGISKEFGTISYIDSTNTLRVSTASDGEWTIVEEDEVSFDWQSFRAEAAKDILAGMMQHKVLSDSSMKLFVPKEQVVSAAIGLADELIKQLKEKEEK